MSQKPLFQPLTMSQVHEAPFNGLTHVSTFSGAGGTCLGFRLAGFRTLWANDIEAHARECYSLNLESPIDGRDIRHLTAADILTATGLSVGALDVFEGSPPCTAFSTAGTRAKGWRQTKDHAGHVQTNVEDLFYDWLRLLEGLQPRAFVAENVAGMVKGVAKGYFKDILLKMKALRYRTEARLLDAQWLGVPQQRCRVIFIGIREDVRQQPAFPSPLSYRYSVQDALPWIRSATYDTRGQWKPKDFSDSPCPAIIGGGIKSGLNACHYLVTDKVIIGDGARLPPSRLRQDHYGTEVIPSRPCPTVTIASPGNDLAVNGNRKFTIAELRRVCSFPDDFQMTGSYVKQWARLGNSVPPLMAKAIAESVRDVLLKADEAAA